MIEQEINKRKYNDSISSIIESLSKDSNVIIQSDMYKIYNEEVVIDFYLKTGNIEIRHGYKTVPFNEDCLNSESVKYFKHSLNEIIIENSFLKWLENKNEKLIIKDNNTYQEQNGMKFLTKMEYEITDGNLVFIYDGYYDVITNFNDLNLKIKIKSETQKYLKELIKNKIRYNIRKKFYDLNKLLVEG